MGGVAHGELRRDGEGLDLRAVLGESRGECCFIEREFLIAVVIVAAADDDEGHAGKGGFDAGTRDHGAVEADEDDADKPAVTFDHGVGGKRGGHGNQRDRRLPGGVERLKRASHGFGDTNGEVAPGGERLGGGNDAMILSGNHRSIGVGAAGIDANKK
jgi:hypothetical protein